MGTAAVRVLSLLLLGLLPPLHADPKLYLVETSDLGRVQPRTRPRLKSRRMHTRHHGGRHDKISKDKSSAEIGALGGTCEDFVESSGSILRRPILTYIVDGLSLDRTFQGLIIESSPNI
jgi:hypothetical protein